MELEKTLKKNDLLYLRQKEGLLYANNERSVLFTTKAFGIYQKDLIENIGIDRMKTFFFKYGYHLGEADAREIMNENISLEEKIEYAPKIHAVKGFEKIRITSSKLEMKGDEVTNFHYKGTWEHSFEAEQYLENFGKSEVPVCHILTGIGTGYASTLIGKEVFFKELQCVAQGAPHCIWETRLVSEWKQEADEFFSYSRDLPIIKELDVTNKKLQEEKHNLTFVYQISTDITNEMIDGKSLDSILELVFKRTDLSIYVEDIRGQALAKKGISSNESDSTIHDEFNSYRKDNPMMKRTEFLQFYHHSRLVRPIYLLGKVVGFCSLIFKDDRPLHTEIDSMILGRLASICSIFFLKEKTEIESMEQVKGHFLNEIISGKYASKREVMRKADLIHIDLADNYFMINLTYGLSENCEERELTIHKTIFETVYHYFNEQSKNVLIGQEADGLILLITEKQLKDGSIQQLIYSLLSVLRKQVKHSVFLAGISTKNGDILEAGTLAEEARSAVRLSSREDPITLFSDLGMIGVLINDQNEKAIRKLMKETLGVLYEDIDDQKVELLETLYQFLVYGGNLEQTSEKLALSKSGLRYRISKITDLLGHDLRDPQMRFQLLMALKALKIIDYHLFRFYH